MAPLISLILHQHHRQYRSLLTQASTAAPHKWLLGLGCRSCSFKDPVWNVWLCSMLSNTHWKQTNPYRMSRFFLGLCTWGESRRKFSLSNVRTYFIFGIQREECMEFKTFPPQIILYWNLTLNRKIETCRNIHTCVHPMWVLLYLDLSPIASAYLQETCLQIVSDNFTGGSSCRLCSITTEGRCFQKAGSTFIHPTISSYNETGLRNLKMQIKR